MTSFLDEGATVLANLDRDEHLREFQERGHDGSLRFQRCAACAYLRYPASAICPQCLSGEAEWVVDSGEGAVWSFCVYRRAFHPAFAPLVPYAVALVELDSGPRLLTNIVNLSPASIHIGLRGRAAPRALPGGASLVYFTATRPEKDQP